MARVLIDSDRAHECYLEEEDQDAVETQGVGNVAAVDGYFILGDLPESQQVEAPEHPVEERRLRLANEVKLETEDDEDHDALDTVLDSNRVVHLRGVVLSDKVITSLAQIVLRVVDNVHAVDFV